MRSDATLLRAYWYDAIVDPVDHRHPEQLRKFHALEETNGLQVRLGHLTKKPAPWEQHLVKALGEFQISYKEFKKVFKYESPHEQKGVDTLLVLDLVKLAQQNVYDTAILIAGDRDLAEAVSTVQQLGKQVILVYPEGAGVSPALRRLADFSVSLSSDTLRRFIAVDEEEDD